MRARQELLEKPVVIEASTGSFDFVGRFTP